MYFIKSKAAGDAVVCNVHALDDAVAIVEDSAGDATLFDDKGKEINVKKFKAAMAAAVEDDSDEE